MSNKCHYPLDQEKRERDGKIATVLAIVLALVPWAVGVPIAYRWSLWGISLASVLYLILTIVPLFKNGLTTLNKYAVAVIVLGLVVLTFSSLATKQWKAERSGEVEGDIRTLQPVAKARVLEIGDSGSRLQFGEGGALTVIPSNVPNGDEGMHMLYNAGLKFDLEDGVILVSTLVRDRQGHLVATIDKNHWSVTSACLDKNYSKDSLEILDARGLVVFQMRLLADRVQLQGEWRDEFGKGVRLSKQGGGHITIWLNPEKEQELMEIIKPTFKYPSVNHWGELSSVSNSGS